MPDYDESYLVGDYGEEDFRNAFADKDVDAAYRILDKIFALEDVAGKVNSNIDMVKIRAYVTFNMIMGIFREYVSDMTQQEIAIGYLNYLIKAQTVAEVNECFKKLVRFQIQAISRIQFQENKGSVAKVVKYVEANYTDCNMNVSTMAESLKHNARYLSRVFKKETQMGILDYINTVRINKARELLAERKYTTEEIAVMVGYNNVRSFRRSFVRVTGEVPSAYMESV